MADVDVDEWHRRLTAVAAGVKECVHDGEGPQQSSPAAPATCACGLLARQGRNQYSHGSARLGLRRRRDAAVRVLATQLTRW
ncbi:hypothetical protein Y900_027565 [Mycolicibacterium aromaticivorans JS19b1 = JCM 16368]|uniref:Uncharacterized protein n=1 Tax=Mycolicibacterium aromaticivorans JS19b1 = JCM 16368 TaxID=1440774 RepID=A0A064CEA2_9MYCO|nr:hypothetical protein Y900_027565 [Mycolicibacterium aromaticivorans JS19b1 = JCM 16368]